MSFCSNCGGRIPEGAAFCGYCGASAENTGYVAPYLNENELFKEEQEFFNMTRNLLRWEKKAWLIVGGVFLAMGIAFGLFFFGFGALFLVMDDYDLSMLSLMYFFYGVLIVSVYIPTAICSICGGNRIKHYLDVMETDFAAVQKRCTSGGMIAFCVCFNTIAMVFYLINFTKFKSCSAVVDRIISRQRSGQV